MVSTDKLRTLWPCGHEKTLENTGKAGVKKPHGVCRTCRNARALRSHHKNYVPVEKKP